jgi:hypothetical protein
MSFSLYIRLLMTLFMYNSVTLSWYSYLLGLSCIVLVPICLLAFNLYLYLSLVLSFSLLCLYIIMLYICFSVYVSTSLSLSRYSFISVLCKQFSLYFLFVLFVVLSLSVSLYSLSVALSSSVSLLFCAEVMKKRNGETGNRVSGNKR